ncbi:MAG: hypothetical protein V4659_02620 [Pseudomonadota bacterium]
MLARLILVLLLSAFSLPAAAANDCHERVTAHHAMPSDHDAPVPATPSQHLCIGCVPPNNWPGQPAAVPTPVTAVPVVATIVRFDVGIAAPPVLPPPKRG